MGVEEACVTREPRAARLMHAARQSYKLKYNKWREFYYGILKQAAFEELTLRRFCHCGTERLFNRT